MKPREVLKPEYHELCRKIWEVKRDHEMSQAETTPDLVDKFGTKLSDFSGRIEQLIDDGYGYLLYLDRLSAAVHDSEQNSTRFD